MILKLGGSVLTQKDDKETFADGFDGILDTVARHTPDDLILVHGAGSFGHPHAARHGLDDGGREGAYETHAAVARLNRRVVSGLNQRGVDALPVHPLSCASRDADGRLRIDMSARALSNEGFVPVLHGDVVAHADRGVSVVSGDEVVVELARDSEHVGMCTSAGGVLDAEGHVLPRVSSLAELPDETTTEATDVTGGIRSKVELLLRLKSGGHVFGVDALDGWLEGDETGTLVRRENE